MLTSATVFSTSSKNNSSSEDQQPNTLDQKVAIIDLNLLVGLDPLTAVYTAIEMFREIENMFSDGCISSLERNEFSSRIDQILELKRGFGNFPWS